MGISISSAVEQLERRALIERQRNTDPDSVIEHVCQLIGRLLPTDLTDFYREKVKFVRDFQAVYPTYNERTGWNEDKDATLRRLLGVGAVPVFFDGVGNLYGLDLDPLEKCSAVYLFNHELEYEREHIAGTSLGSFLLILADMDQAVAEDWPEGWQLRIDPDLEKPAKAPPEWKISLW